MREVEIMKITLNAQEKIKRISDKIKQENERMTNQSKMIKKIFGCDLIPIVDRQNEYIFQLNDPLGRPEHRFKVRLDSDGAKLLEQKIDLVTSPRKQELLNRAFHKNDFPSYFSLFGTIHPEQL